MSRTRASGRMRPARRSGSAGVPSVWTPVSAPVQPVQEERLIAGVDQVSGRMERQRIRGQSR